MKLSNLSRQHLGVAMAAAVLAATATLHADTITSWSSMTNSATDYQYTGTSNAGVAVTTPLVGNSLEMTNTTPGTLTLGAGSSLTTNQIKNSGANTFAVINNTGVTDYLYIGNSGTLTLNTASAGIRIAVSIKDGTDINNNPVAGNLVVTGTGLTFIDQGTVNTLSGSLTVQTGATLQLGWSTVFNNLSAVNLNGGTIDMTSNGAATALGIGNMTITGGTLKRSGGGSRTFLTSSSVQYWNGDFTFDTTNATAFNGTVKLGGNRTVTSTTNSATTVGAIGDDGNGYSLTKDGAGALTLSGSNTFSGALIAKAGTLNLSSATGTTQANTVLSIYSGATVATVASSTNTFAGLTDGDANGGGTLTYISTGGAGNYVLAGNDSNQTYTFTGTITNSAGRTTSITKSGASTQVLSGSNSNYIGATKVLGGVLSVDTLTNEAINGYTNTTSGSANVTVTSAVLADLNNAGVGIGSSVTGTGIAAGTTITGISGTTITLSQAASVTGTNATLAYGTSNGSSIGASTANSTSLIIDGGTLRYTGADVSTNRLFQIGTTVDGGTGTIEASGTGALNFTNASKITYGTNNQTRNLVLSGTNTGNNTLASLITNDGSGAVTVTKKGNGTWVLTNANTFTGGTTINSGLLKVANTTGSATGTGAVTVGDGIGTARLGGTGIISGAVTVNNHSAIDTGDGTIGALTLGGGLTLNTGSSLVIDLGAAGADHTSPGIADLLTLTGAAKVLNLSSGMNLVLNSGSENLVDTGSYKLLAYAGTVQIDGAAQSSTLDITNLFTLTGFDGVQTTITLDTANKAIWLDYTATAPVPEPAAFTLLATGIGGLMLIRRKRR